MARLLPAPLRTVPPASRLCAAVLGLVLYCAAAAGADTPAPFAALQSSCGPGTPAALAAPAASGGPPQPLAAVHASVAASFTGAAGPLQLAAGDTVWRTQPRPYQA